MTDENDRVGGLHQSGKHPGSSRDITPVLTAKRACIEWPRRDVTKGFWKEALGGRRQQTVKYAEIEFLRQRLNLKRGSWECKSTCLDRPARRARPHRSMIKLHACRESYRTLSSGSAQAGVGTSQVALRVVTLNISMPHEVK